MYSYLKQGNTAYEREDGYYGQYYDTLSVSFFNILKHIIMFATMNNYILKLNALHNRHEAFFGSLKASATSCFLLGVWQSARTCPNRYTRPRQKDVSGWQTAPARLLRSGGWPGGQASTPLLLRTLRCAQFQLCLCKQRFVCSIKVRPEKNSL